MRNSKSIVICIIAFSVAGCSGLGVSTDPTLGFPLMEAQASGENLWGEAEDGLPDEVAVESLAESRVADVLRGTDDEPGWNGHGAPGETTPRLDNVFERIMFFGSAQTRDTRTASAR